MDIYGDDESDYYRQRRRERREDDYKDFRQNQQDVYRTRRHPPSPQPVVNNIYMDEIPERRPRHESPYRISTPRPPSPAPEVPRSPPGVPQPVYVPYPVSTERRGRSRDRLDDEISEGMAEMNLRGRLRRRARSPSSFTEWRLEQNERKLEEYRRRLWEKEDELRRFERQEKQLERHRGPANLEETQYRRPQTVEGQWLSYEITLRDDRSFVSHNAKQGIALPPINSVIAATQRTMEEDVVIDLSYTEQPGGQSDFRWLHIQSDNVSLEKLEGSIPQLPGIGESEILLARRLIHDQLKTHGGTFENATNWPSSVLRYDCRTEFGAQDQGDLSVTLLSIPYFVLHTEANALGPERHSIRTLLQSLYPYEDASDRDRRQMFTKYGLITGKEILCISYTLALVFPDCKHLPNLPS
jgi:hypothetical protein